ncbi:M1 family aminopeptidase [Candidatus Aalborgicola defluviihabitans]|uniref:M1 family aminopeptidase n=1 Tax=Candidatus Aalborgicola defluviihabitans TaxID=3386187 RepID=UPI0039B878ED
MATAFSTSQWTPCPDAPSVRASLMLALVLQSQLVSVGNGNPRAPLQQPADDEQIEAAPTKYKGLKDAGLDRPLVFPDWDAPTAADRSLVYDKGTLVVHELRKLMGEERFWKGFARYTRTHWGQSVETADFQRAMEASSGIDLSAFFRRWVYLQD